MGDPATWRAMTALQVGAEIAAGRVDPVELIDALYEAIAAADPEHVIFLRTTPDRARAEAMAARERVKRGWTRGPLDGVPISWKDLYDTAGVATEGGSALMKGRIPTQDALVLKRATLAGTVCLGKTNTSELAFSGLGINPTTGTPSNPHDAETPRCPGGSSSGAATSVARHLAFGGIGSDTGGSVRTPAAWCGVVGLKTTHGLLPLEGVVPLSPSLDTIGPLTRDVADAGALYAVMRGEKPADLAGASLEGRRFLVADGLPFEEAEPEVVASFEAGVEKLGRAGAIIERAEIPELRQSLDACALLVAIEGYATWGEEAERHPDRVFHQILNRLRLGGQVPAVQMLREIRDLDRVTAAYLARTAAFDAVLMPTVAVVAPSIAALLADEDLYRRINILSLRNTRMGNLLDLCGLSLPVGPTPAGMPVGLMAQARPNSEGALLRLGVAMERALAA